MGEETSCRCPSGPLATASTIEQSVRLTATGPSARARDDDVGLGDAVGDHRRVGFAVELAGTAVGEDLVEWTWRWVERSGELGELIRIRDDRPRCRRFAQARSPPRWWRVRRPPSARRPAPTPTTCPRRRLAPRLSSGLRPAPPACRRCRCVEGGAAGRLCRRFRRLLTGRRRLVVVIAVGDREPADDDQGDRRRGRDALHPPRPSPADRAERRWAAHRDARRRSHAARRRWTRQRRSLLRGSTTVLTAHRRARRAPAGGVRLRRRSAASLSTRARSTSETSPSR